MYRIAFLITVFFLIMSCSSEKPSDIKVQKPSGTAGESSVSDTSSAGGSLMPGSYSLEIRPFDATRNSTLHVIPKGFNLPDAEIEWLVNGNPAFSPLPDQFKTLETKKGDSIKAKAIIEGREIVSNAVQIKNTPPEIGKVKILPEVFKPGDTLYVDVEGGDIDGDDVTISYEWTKNGEPAGNSSRLESQVKRGDTISVKITPFDGEGYGRPVTLKREVTNMPPVIIEDRKVNFDGKVWTYQVKATDPDNDPLTYSLKSGPAGMTIDSSTGFIRWNVPPDFKEKAAASVVVSDGHGGEAAYNFNVNMKAESPKPK